MKNRGTSPVSRNHYAHGSTALHKTVLGTFRIVSEIINAVYATNAGEKK